MSIEDGFCTLAELADGMAAAVVTKYARPPGEVFTWQDSDGELDSMDTSENIRIVSRQNAVLEVLRLIDQGEISPLNMSLMPAAQPVPYEYFDRRIIRREQAAQILQRMFGTTPAPQPQAAAPEQEAPKGPLALTTGDIAFCFDGLRWNEEQWRKPLGYPPKWLQSCIVIPGQRGVREATWNPVSIAGRLVKDGYVKARSARARFQTKPQLAPWLEVWKTYEADYLDND